MKISFGTRYSINIIIKIFNKINIVISISYLKAFNTSDMPIDFFIFYFLNIIVCFILYISGLLFNNASTFLFFTFLDFLKFYYRQI